MPRLLRKAYCKYRESDMTIWRHGLGISGFGSTSAAHPPYEDGGIDLCPMDSLLRSVAVWLASRDYLTTSSSFLQSFHCWSRRYCFWHFTAGWRPSKRHSMRTARAPVDERLPPTAPAGLFSSQCPVPGGIDPGLFAPSAGSRGRKGLVALVHVGSFELALFARH
jgi:hypothetical protein